MNILKEFDKENTPYLISVSKPFLGDFHGLELDYFVIVDKSAVKDEEWGFEKNLEVNLYEKELNGGELNYFFKNNNRFNKVLEENGVEFYELKNNSFKNFVKSLEVEV